MLKTVAGDEIDRISSLPEVMENQRQVFAAFYRGDAVMGPRAIISNKENAQFTYISRASNNGPTTVKFGSVTPSNSNRNLSVVQTTVAVMSAETGSILTLLDGESVTKWRTVAASMAAAKTLSNPVKTVAIVGAGHQGIAHAVAAEKVFAPEKMIFISKKSVELPTFNCEVEVSSEIDRIAGAELIFLCTNSQVPVLEKSLKAGTTCISIGSFAPNRSEVSESALICADKVFGDDAITIQEQCGSVVAALPSADRMWEKVVSIGAVYSGESLGRSNEHEVIYYFSVGLGIQDAAMAEYILAKLP